MECISIKNALSTIEVTVENERLIAIGKITIYDKLTWPILRLYLRLTTVIKIFGLVGTTTDFQMGQFPKTSQKRYRMSQIHRRNTSLKFIESSSFKAIPFFVWNYTGF
jgi:hypothetical protein